MGRCPVNILGHRRFLEGIASKTGCVGGGKTRNPSFSKVCEAWGLNHRNYPPGIKHGNGKSHVYR